jgi:glycine cleavage system H protein
VLAEEKNQVTIGITDYTQAMLGEIIEVDLPSAEGFVDVGDDVCVIEGTNTVLEVCAPLAGELIAINNDLIDAPGFINTDPYGDGWLYKLKLQDKEEYNKLLDVEEYMDLVNEEEA